MNGSSIHVIIVALAGLPEARRRVCIWTTIALGRIAAVLSVELTM